jgi:hypothetical protein
VKERTDRVRAPLEKRIRLQSDLRDVASGNVRKRSKSAKTITLAAENAALTKNVE